MCLNRVMCMLKKVMQEINQDVLIRLSLDAMIAGYLYFITCIFYSSQFFHNKHVFFYILKKTSLITNLFNEELLL